MKQQITKEQWNELTDDNKDKFLLTLGIIIKTSALGPSEMPRQGRTVDGVLPTIGQLIEYLGADLEIRRTLTDQWLVDLDGESFVKDELIDALWEATKYKLKNL